MRVTGHRLFEGFRVKWQTMQRCLKAKTYVRKAVPHHAQRPLTS